MDSLIIVIRLVISSTAMVLIWRTCTVIYYLYWYPYILYCACGVRSQHIRQLTNKWSFYFLICYPRPFHSYSMHSFIVRHVTIYSKAAGRFVDRFAHLLSLLVGLLSLLVGLLSLLVGLLVVLLIGLLNLLVGLLTLLVDLLVGLQIGLLVGLRIGLLVGCWVCWQVIYMHLAGWVYLYCTAIQWMKSSRWANLVIGDLYTFITLLSFIVRLAVYNDSSFDVKDMLGCSVETVNVIQMMFICKASSIKFVGLYSLCAFCWYRSVLLKRLLQVWCGQKGYHIIMLFGAKFLKLHLEMEWVDLWQLL